ncbi:sel1 repeat family protein [Pelomyxa schiedti]|nr:sel1 repeat family protein [Pelomyxa schiedti]
MATTTQCRPIITMNAVPGGGVVGTVTRWAGPRPSGPRSSAALPSTIVIAGDERQEPQQPEVKRRRSANSNSNAATSCVGVGIVGRNFSFVRVLCSSAVSGIEFEVKCIGNGHPELFRNQSYILKVLRFWGKWFPHDKSKAWSLWESAASQGCTWEMCCLGQWYELRDTNKAASLFQMAVDCGDSRGIFSLGRCIDFQHAVDAGCTASAYYLGTCYRDGEGVVKDSRKAVELTPLNWLLLRTIELTQQTMTDRATFFGDLVERALWGGNGDTLHMLAESYYYGRGVDQDCHKAAQLYQKALDCGHTASTYGLACCYYEENDFRTAAVLYQKALDAGIIKAAYDLGFCYDRGKGVDTDTTRAAELYQRAADAGVVDAMYELGGFYYHGRGVEQDFHKAANLWQKSMAGGDTDSAFVLGMCYFFGQGVEKNTTRAAVLLQTAANNGNPEAFTRLGDCYYTGTGVERNLHKAAILYQQALDHGSRNTMSAYALGYCYLNGDGVEKDTKKAVGLFYSGAECGDHNARYMLGKCYKSGEGVGSVDMRTAAKFFRLAVAEGDYDAQEELHEMIDDSEDGDDDQLSSDDSDD